MKYVVEKFGVEIPSQKLEFRRQVGNSRWTSRGFSDPYTSSNTANINALPQLPPNTGCCGSTRITTPEGAVRIDELQPGQLLGNGENRCKVGSVLTGTAPRDCFLLRALRFGIKLGNNAMSLTWKDHVCSTVLHTSAPIQTMGKALVGASVGVGS